MTTEEVLARRLEESPYWNLLGMKVEVIKEDYIELILPFSNELNQSLKLMHGGAIASLVDAAGAVIFLSKMDLQKETLSTVELKVNYLNPVTMQKSSYLLARSHAVKMGKTIAVSQVEVKDNNNTNIAIGIGTYAISR